MEAPSAEPMRCMRWSRCRPASRSRRSPSAAPERRTAPTWRPASSRCPMTTWPPGSRHSATTRRRRPSSASTRARRDRPVRPAGAARDLRGAAPPRPVAADRAAHRRGASRRGCRAGGRLRADPGRRRLGRPAARPRDRARVAARCHRLPALRHRAAPMVGRSHGIHAEPITFGFKAAGWLAELRRDADRLERARETIGVGSISGAVGTHANVSAEVEAHVLAGLGLAADPAPTQVVSRDRHAELLTALAILGGTLERIAVEIRHLQRTEVGEAFEPFGSGQQGSSAMPHKRNPILAERVTGMARLLRADALIGLENMALWHERDISHSSAERFVFERALGVAAYATRTTADILDGLEVDAERMRANLDQLGGMVYSEALLLAMVAKGADRQDAYRLVQGAARRAWAGTSA